MGNTDSELAMNNDLLKKEWKFVGVSDVRTERAPTDTVGPVTGGLDLEMPSGTDDPHGEGCACRGKNSQRTIDDSASILPRCAVFLFDRPQLEAPSQPMTAVEEEVAYEAACAAIKLLRN